MEHYSSKKKPKTFGEEQCHNSSSDESSITEISSNEDDRYSEDDE